MLELVTTTARGRACWGSTTHLIELAVRTTTRVSSSGHVSDAARRWEIVFGDDGVDRRDFANEADRDAFIRETLTSVELQPEDSPLHLYVDPRVTTPSCVLRRGDAGWADGIIGLIGARLSAVDEVLGR